MKDRGSGAESRRGNSPCSENRSLFHIPFRFGLLHSRLVLLMGIALLFVLLDAFPCYAAPPVVSNIPDQTIAEGGSFATISLDYYVWDDYTPDYQMTWTYSGNTELTVTIDGNRVATIGIPSADWNGSESITFTAEDNSGNTDSDAASFTVTAVNDAPVASDDSATVSEDSTNNVIDVLSDDTDVEGDDLTVASVTQAANGSVTNNGLDVSYTPDGNYNGSDTFTYTVSDGNGGTDTATVSVTVTSVNDPPVAADDSATVSEDSADNVIAVLGNDTDVDQDSLTVASVTQPGNGTVTNNGSDVSYTPDADFNGSDTFTYTVSDGNGGTDTATVNVTVTSVNDPPVASDDSATVSEDSTNNDIDVLSNDTDVDQDSLTVASVAQPGNGTVTNNGSDVSYTPDSNFNGSDTFTYTISDGNGGTDTATVNVTVTSVNDPLVAADDSATVSEDSADNVIEVLSNDTDADGDSLTVASVTQPTNGSVTNNGSDVSYTPDANYNGSDSFTYTVSDGNGGTDTATVSVTVTSVNDPPVAGDDSATTPEDTPVGINVVVNDGDIDGAIDPTTVTIGQQPLNGSVTIDWLTGEVTYTPAADYSGLDTFTYTVRDNSGAASNEATVSVNVTMVFYTLTMQVSPSGGGTTAPAVHDYRSDTVVDVEATAKSGYQFDHWEGDLSGSANPTSITMTSDKTVRAVFFALEPSIGIVKEASAATATVSDTITYTYSVTNTGNVTLTDVSAADDVLGAVALGAATLGPGESTSGTLSYTVQESDLPGPLVNSATVTGTPPTGAAVSDRSSTATVSLASNAAIDLLLETSATEAHVGDAITYTYTVTNTGDVTLTDIEVNDDLLGSISLEASTLAPGERTTGKAVYVVQASDPPWPIVDAATVVGISPTGESVTDDSAPVIVNLFPSGEPAIEVTKTTDPTAARVNDEITYTYTVTNTGNVPLMDVSLTDELLGVIGLATSALAPGESTTATAVDNVMESDLPGPLRTSATVSASDAFGRIAADQASAAVTLEVESADVERTSQGQIAGREEIIVSSYDGKVIISEVAWAGTAVDPWGEWIELRNLGTTSVDLSDWTLRWRRKYPSTPDEERWKVIGLAGMLMPSTTPLDELYGHESIPSVSVVKNDRDDISWLVLYESEEKDGSHYFLERWHDATVSDVTADLVYDTAPPYDLELSDRGDVIELLDAQGVLIDSANAFESELNGWPAGDASIFASMERTDPLGPDTAENWHTNQGIITHGFDALGRPLVASAGVPNPMLLDENTLFADLPATEHRVGEQLKVGLQLPKAGRNVLAGPWIYAASDLGGAVGGGAAVGGAGNDGSFTDCSNALEQLLQKTDAEANSTTTRRWARSDRRYPVNEESGMQLNVWLELPTDASEASATVQTDVPLLEPAEAVGGGGTADNTSAHASSSRDTEDTYWLVIDTSDLLPGRYDFWVGTGVGKAVVVPVVILP